MKRLFALSLILLLCGCLQEKEVSHIKTSSPGISITDLIEPYTTPLTSSACPATTTSTTLPFSPVVDVLQSGWASTTPEIDGIMHEDEWSDASVIILSGFDRLYVMNNQTHLFLLYIVLDGSRFNEDTAIFIDPTSDGRYDYIYGDSRIFVVLPLFEGFVGDGGGVYCGNSNFGVDNKFCGEYYQYVVSESTKAHSRTPTYITSEVSIPIDSREHVFFWLLYGHPSTKCFPEATQCHTKPVFSEIVVAETAGEGKTYLHGDSIGPLDYYDIRPLI